MRSLVMAMLLSLLVGSSMAQECDGNVPNLIVDLTSSPTATYLSPTIVRNGYCCGVTGNDRCIRFELTLHPDAQGINFNVCAGAVPPGALYYQIGCGPQYAVGTPICLNGPGPHILTFCKPGNNNNQYCITSIPAPSAGPPITLNEGCVGTLSSSGFAPGTIQWTSISPGAPGAYNNYLSCPTCATTNVVAQPGYPAYVDYQVCGLGISPCSQQAFCDTVRVNFYSTLTATIIPVQPTVCFGATGTTITVVGGGGSPPYNYLWNNGQNTPSIYVGPGTYSVTLSDNSDCPPTTASVVVTQFLQPIEALAGTDIVVCGSGPVAQLNASVTGVTTGQWITGNGQFAPSNTALTGTYTPTNAEVAAGYVDLVLATTNNGTCPGDQDTVRVFFDPGITNGAVTGVNATCNGVANGSASFTPANPSFTYLWNDPQAQTSSTATGLMAGTYTVTATNALGCLVTLPVTIGQPVALAIASMDVDNETCAGMGNGMVTVNMTGGTPPYSYTWNVPGTGPTVIGGAGTYSVSVSDANGCTAVQGSANVQAIGQPNVADAGADLVGCNGDPIPLQGSVQNATSGLWSGGNGVFNGNGLNVQYQPTAAEVLAGSVVLSLTTIGNTSCPPASDQVTVSLSNSFLTAGITSTDATCNGVANGTATFAPVVPGMSFQWQGLPGQTGATATGLPAGAQSVVVTDDLGCTATYTATISQPDALVIADMSVINESCAGTGNGSVTVTMSGGTQPYSYSWNVAGTGPSITGTAGNYTVTVTDANGCASVQGTASIAADGQPNLANAGADIIACDGELPVALQGTVTNATGGIWSGGNGAFIGTGSNVDYQPSASEILNGSVTLTFTTTGNTSCPPASDQVMISLSNAFLVAELSAVHVLCAGISTGSLLYSPALPGLTYAWSGQSATGPGLNALSAGTYSVHVTDQLGCSETFSATITEPSALSITGTSTAPVTCIGLYNGVGSIDVEGGVPPYSYLWSESAGSQTAQTAIGLGSGTHGITVTDANGCTVGSAVNVGQPAPITLIANIPEEVCVNVPVQLSASASGGNGGYQYHWPGIGNGAALTHIFSTSQTVTVSVTDANNCAGPVLEIPIIVHDLSSADIITYGDTIACPGGEATVGVSISEYLGDYTVYWPQLGVTGTGPFTVPVTSSMTLDLIITDQCGQTITGTVALGLQTPPNISLPPLIAQGCSPLTVQLPANLTGQQVSYQWDLGNGTTSTQPAPTVVYNNPGTYTVSLTVTTPLGCSATAQNTGQVIVSPSPTVSMNANPWITHVDDATIDFTMQSTGNIVSSYWTFGDGGFSNAAAPSHTYNDIGSYMVNLMVQDANGCTNTAIGQVEITPVYDITVPNIFTPDLTGGGSGVYDPWALNNDIFYPFIRYVKDFRMRVFNRWGELIFESNDLQRGWDGYYRDQLSPQDVYVYQLWVRFVDGKEKHQLGDITLMR